MDGETSAYHFTNKLYINHSVYTTCTIIDNCMVSVGNTFILSLDLLLELREGIGDFCLCGPREDGRLHTFSQQIVKGRRVRSFKDLHIVTRHWQEHVLSHSTVFFPKICSIQLFSPSCLCLALSSLYHSIQFLY